MSVISTDKAVLDVWNEKPLHALIDHIVEHSHEDLRRDLARLVEMAQQVETVHSERLLCPIGLRDHLAQMAVEMERHMQKEERILFPMIRDGRGILAIMSIYVMEREHETAVEDLAGLRRLTHDFFVPGYACLTWRELCSKLTRFEEAMLGHMHLEDSVLFPRALGENRVQEAR
jgi:regulator of cell morphogenesis and NO signaling